MTRLPDISNLKINNAGAMALAKGDEMSDYVIASYKVLLDDAKRLIAAAELEWCPDCKGKGIVNPIENPPYKCDLCDGRGWISGYVRNEDAK